jgi:transcriptional regulator with XRE-family HTH domain
MRWAGAGLRMQKPRDGRIRALRGGKAWTAEQMANALGVQPATYRKYETENMMPHYLIERFALIKGRSIEYIFTGKDAAGRAPRPDCHHDKGEKYG